MPIIEKSSLFLKRQFVHLIQITNALMFSGKIHNVITSVAIIIVVVVIIIIPALHGGGIHV
ncbi:hypothetical protein GCM10011379_56940 [Filimonas zeae]|uniref:Uncharacterized protein n=1 Tax=Filimonas zeae TaxID=1737353 RepID=A0A917J3X0_9BACT|nr:hypothetical protein GCM10011379_56940 [Filimonas zeae]